MRRTTQDFCALLLAAAARPLISDVDRAARRSLFNVLGTAVSAAISDAATVLRHAAGEANGAGDVTLPGRVRTLDPYWGALAIGTAAHLDDFDDTHLATVIHPGAATLATALSLVPETRPSGRRFLGAFAAGCEAQLRIGCAISPAHYDHGWHITGTCGVFGAAVAASVLLRLDAATAANALSLAATMTAGHREAFGTMTKPLHAGKAAANGVLAARLAAAGLTGPEDILGPGGVLEVLGDKVDRDALGLGWPDGHRWELELNTIKTYPCGVVAHPAMDAAIAVSGEIGDPAEITGITLRCNPLVPELMGRVQPADGLGSRFSARHGVAVGLLYGRAGLAEFSDATATAPEVARLRALITLDPDPAVARDAATLRIARRGAPPVEATVEHTRGSAARPLTDDEVLDKVRALFGPVLGAAAADRAWAAIGRLAAAEDTSELLAALRPAPMPALARDATVVSAPGVTDVSAGARELVAAGAATGSAPGAGVSGGGAAAGAGADSARTDSAGTEGAGAGSTGAGSTGADSTGADSAGADSTGADSAGADSTGADSAGADSAGADSAEDPTGSTAEILDLARHAVHTDQAEASLAAFGKIAARGADTPAVLALRAVRPPWVPDADVAWTAWLTAAAASAAAAEVAAEKGGTARLAACAAVAALAGSGGGGRERPAAAVAAGVQAAALVESRLTDWDGWSGASVAATIGAVVAAGLTLGLTEGQLRNALGIAATQAAGLRAAESTDAGPLQAGKAAFNGVEAARLAQAGLTAPADPLDGRRGLFALFGSGSGE
jgi:2-methylcitrate dehydratase PrpD